MENETQNTGNLLSGQEPHQKEEMEQAEKASVASFTLEPEKGLTEIGNDTHNIKKASGEGDASSAGFDSVSDVDLDDDGTEVTEEDLQALDGRDEDSTM